MGFLDFLTSTKRAPAGVTPLSPQEVRDRLMGLNRPDAPYRLVDGSAEKVDFIAEWKIDDPEWHKGLGGANVRTTFRIFLKLHPEAREVRAVDRQYTVSWSGDQPTLSAAVSTFRGQTRSVEVSRTYSFGKTAEPVGERAYRFDTNELKKPIQEAVTSCGWTYRGVVFGKL